MMAYELIRGVLLLTLLAVTLNVSTFFFRVLTSGRGLQKDV